MVYSLEARLFTCFENKSMNDKNSYFEENQEENFRCMDYKLTDFCWAINILHRKYTTQTKEKDLGHRIRQLISSHQNIGALRSATRLIMSIFINEFVGQNTIRNSRTVFLTFICFIFCYFLATVR